MQIDQMNAAATQVDLVAHRRACRSPGSLHDVLRGANRKPTCQKQFPIAFDMPSADAKKLLFIVRCPFLHHHDVGLCRINELRHRRGRQRVAMAIASQDSQVRAGGRP